MGPFFWGGLIGILGGLIGLGGAEFRLPLLVSIYKLRPVQAIVVNLILSLVTVLFSFIFRGAFVNIDRAHAPIIINILVGSLIGSYLGVRFATKINEDTLTRIVAVFLVVLSVVLIGHAFLFHAESLSVALPIKFVLGALAGVVIGVFSSMLGVAGGELIIPTIVLLFAVNIKLAGSLSLAISIPTIIVGLLKYKGKGKLSGLPTRFIVSMSAGSILGALAGSYLLGLVSVSVLQVLLGIILLVSAVKLWRSHSQAVNLAATTK